jgi:superfamily II DNA or RNA helicase
MRIPKSGDLVVIRRQRWRVVNINRYPLCQLLSVVGAAAANAGASRRFLLPFEGVLEAEHTGRFRFVVPRRWRSACRALLARNTPPDGLKAAGSARFDLWPHQLEPAIAIVRGRGSRVLLADDVGLGKTIQAGLIVTELRARGLADRVLVLVPAGLRDQWTEELSSRFSIDASVVDVHGIRRLSAALPVGLNPWTTIPVAVTSIDYVKRPEVLAAVAQGTWDVVIVDEAHGAASDTERHTAASRLTSRAGYVVLVTATPHNGDSRAFEALCALGSHGDSLMVYRRTRQAVAPGTRRRVHILSVRMSAAEARMHARLREFARIVEAERQSELVRLTLSVLHKRALSSPMSLARSVGRRLAVLEDDEANGSHQLVLPLDDGGGELDSSDDVPYWPPACSLGDRNHERGLLTGLAEAAAQAARPGHDTKIAAVLRLIRRIEEPVVVFTEFRDTLLHVRDRLTMATSVLHGGLARMDRRAALEDFSRGRSAILLATDAGGEGLNLQERCRVVINLELPWNPMRLEQRIGRVDRIGQRRTVHAFHLLARASGEEEILQRLQLRVRRAGHDIVTSDPLVGEPVGARRARGGVQDPLDAREHSSASSMPSRQSIDLAAEASAEVARLGFVRSVARAEDGIALRAVESLGTWASRARRHATRRFLGHTALAMMVVEWEDGHGRVCHSILVPVELGLPADRAQAGRRFWRAVLDAHRDAIRVAVDRAIEHIDSTLRPRLAAMFDIQWRRQRAIATADVVGSQAPWQEGLFDRRAERDHALGSAAVAVATLEREQRIVGLEQSKALTRRPPRVLLVLLP